jgi:hypothetical protein
MKEDLDLSDVLDAVDRVQRNYRKPLPGMKVKPNRGADIQPSGDSQPLESASES